MSSQFDAIIIGAALNGLAAAVALGGSTLRRPLDILVIDAKDPETFANTAFDGRASAVTASACRMFEVLGVWPGIAPHAQAMREIIVTDSKHGSDDRPVLLDFGERDMRGQPTAHMVENRFLYGEMLKAAKASPHIRFAAGSPVSGYSFGPGLAEARLVDGTVHRASLIVAADGRNSSARQAAAITMHGWPYGQTGIVVTVEHDLPHNGRAEEHFTPSGPFAILPLPGNRSSLVWCEWEADAKRILALTEAEFLEELRRRFGDHRGALRLDSGRHGYPLGMYVARDITGPRLALIGDAAHVLHPLAGLGFNLGLRDVAALADCVHEAVAIGQDPGSDAVLGRYASWRRFDTVATAAAMDGMNRLFSNDHPVLKAVRDAGLAVVNRLPPLKAAFAGEAAGQFGALPRLMRGERI